MRTIRNTFWLATVITVAVTTLLVFAALTIIKPTSTGQTISAHDSIPLESSADVNGNIAQTLPIASPTDTPRVVSLNPPFTSLTPATSEQMEGWLQKRFAEEYKEITIHRAIELGEPESTPDGYSIVTFKYVGSFGWKKGYFLSHRRYTFTANGDFVRSDIVTPKVTADTLLDLLPP